MDLLTIIFACSLHPDDRLVEAFIRKVSDANPLFLGDFVSLVTHDDLTSPEQAVEMAEALLAKGGRPALGLMAIPISWAARFNRTPADLLDACTNVAIGTAMMSAFAADCVRSSHHRRHGSYTMMSRRMLESTRACVLSGFDREIGVQGFTKIIAEIARLPAAAADSDPPAQRSNFWDADPPTVRPQAPLTVPSPTASGPAPAPPIPPRSPQATRSTMPSQPAAHEGPRASGRPSSPRAPIARPGAAAE